MSASTQHDIMRLVVRGSLDLLLHDNADMIDLFEESNRSDLTETLNTLESSFMWLKKQLETAEKENA